MAHMLISNDYLHKIKLKSNISSSYIANSPKSIHIEERKSRIPEEGY